MFIIEQIRKNPHDVNSTDWHLLNQKVLRTVEYSEPPCIFGHIDIMANQRPRIIRAMAQTDCVVLKGEAKLLFEYLDKDQLKMLSASTSAANPYDIGQTYLNARLDEQRHNTLFLDSVGHNPYRKGIKVQPYKQRDKFSSKKGAKSLKIDRNYGH